MSRAIFAAVVLLAGAAPARAQAWLGSQGEITTSFVVSRSFADGHDLNGLRDMNADIFTNSLLADVTFSVRDNLAVTVALPIVSSKFASRGTPGSFSARSVTPATRRAVPPTCTSRFTLRASKP